MQPYKQVPPTRPAPPPPNKPKPVARPAVPEVPRKPQMNQTSSSSPAHNSFGNTAPASRDQWNDQQLHGVHQSAADDTSQLSVLEKVSLFANNWTRCHL